MALQGFISATACFTRDIAWHELNVKCYDVTENPTVNYRVNQPIKRVLVAWKQADEFIDLDDLVTRLCFMDDYIVTASVHAGFLGFAQHSK